MLRNIINQSIRWLRGPENQFVAGFEHDPFGYLDRALAAGHSTLRTGPDEVSCGDPSLVRAIFLNQDQNYQEHSDFFGTPLGLFGPAQACAQIRRDAYALLKVFAGNLTVQSLTPLIDTLPSLSHWPDTGNKLMFGVLKPLLLTPNAPLPLQELLSAVVERSVLKSSTRAKPSFFRTRVWRFRVAWALSVAIETRRQKRSSNPQDLLDVVVRAATHGQSNALIGEVYLAFLFSIAGSLGFLLGWSIYLRGTHELRPMPALWTVREALRLWPVAWRLERSPRFAGTLSGHPVSPTSKVLVCPYLAHRNPAYWSEPQVYLPERWADPKLAKNAAFFPFGFGPQRCIAADLSPFMVALVIETIAARYATEVKPTQSSTPIPENVLASPTFDLKLTKKNIVNIPLL